MQTTSLDSIWVDISGNHSVQAQKLDDLREEKGGCITDILYDEALNAVQFPEALCLGDGILLRVPNRQQWDSAQNSYMTFILLPQHLITMHQNHEQEFATIRKRLAGNVSLHDITPVDLLLYILDGLIDGNIHAYTQARMKIESLADEVNRHDDESDGDKIANLRRQMARLASQFEDQLHSFASLAVLTMSQPRCAESGLREGVRSIQEVQAHLLRSVTRLEGRLRDVQDTRDAILQQRTERRLRQLTIITTLFMPLSLVTGIYGMNFYHLPVMQWRYGYLIVIGAMLAVALVLLIFYARKGWLK